VTASGIILAAGRGERFGGPKVLAELGGVPVLLHSVRAFLSSQVVQELIVVAQPTMEPQVVALLEALDFPVRVVPGGKRRRDSALAGVEEAKSEYVLIHDAARPLVPPELIRRVLRAAEEHGAAVPVIPVVDTLRYVENGFLSGKSVSRTGLFAMQTPQAFRRDLLLSALREADEELPDDAEALLRRGIPVAAVPGDPKNLKITYPEDLLLLARLL